MGANIIYEIPDLPLRSHSSVLNNVICYIFRIVTYILFEKVVITSAAFKRKLSKNMNFFECENFPSGKILRRKTTELSIDKLTISFVGVIRYLFQMKMLIKYASERSVNIRFYGGPEKQITELKSYCDILEVTNVSFYGIFSPSELEKIYAETDYIYSVYDSQQDNVKLALPNKLYESILFKKPIIVASETYLLERVLHANCGFGVSSSDYSLFCKQMDQGILKEYSFETEKLIANIISQKLNFKKWILSE